MIQACSSFVPLSSVNSKFIESFCTQKTRKNIAWLGNNDFLFWKVTLCSTGSVPWIYWRRFRLRCCSAFGLCPGRARDAICCLSCCFLVCSTRHYQHPFRQIIAQHKKGKLPNLIRGKGPLGHSTQDAQKRDPCTSFPSLCDCWDHSIRKLEKCDCWIPMRNCCGAAALDSVFLDFATKKQILPVWMKGKFSFSAAEPWRQQSSVADPSMRPLSVTGLLRQHKFWWKTKSNTRCISRALSLGVKMDGENIYRNVFINNGCGNCYQGPFTTCPLVHIINHWHCPGTHSCACLHFGPHHALNIGRNCCKPHSHNRL